MEDYKRLLEIEERLKKATEEIDSLKREVNLLKSKVFIENQDILKRSVEEKVNEPTLINNSKIGEKSIPPKMIDKVIEKGSENEAINKDYEKIIGQIWLPRIFILILIIGILWAFKLAINEGWLTEGMRSALGIATGIILFIVADKQISKERYGLGKSLYVGSIGVLVFTTFAMSFLYEIIPSLIGFVIGFIWVAIGIAKAIQLKSQTMGVMFSFVGQLLPFIMGGESSEISIILLIVYEFIFYVALFYLAILNQYIILKWFSSVAYVGTNIIILFILPIGYGTFYEQVVILLIVVAVLQHILIFYDVYKRAKLNDTTAISLLLASFFNTLIWGWYGYGNTFNEHNANVFTFELTFYMVGYGIITFNAYRKELTKLFGIALLLVVIAFTINLLQLSLGAYSEQMKLAIYILQGVALVYIGYRYSLIVQRIIGCILLMFTMLFMLPFYSLPDSLFGETVQYVSYIHNNIFSLILWLLWLVAMFVLAEMVFRYSHWNSKYVLKMAINTASTAIFLMKLGVVNEIFNYSTVLWLIILGVLMYIYKFVKDECPKIAKRLFAAYNIVLHLLFISFFIYSLDVSYDVRLMGITFGWLVYAIVAIVLGFKLEKKTLRVIGLILVFCALMKLFLIDLTILDFTIRAILFIIVGIVGMFVSRLFYKK